MAYEKELSNDYVRINKAVLATMPSAVAECVQGLRKRGIGSVRIRRISGYSHYFAEGEKYWFFFGNKAVSASVGREVGDPTINRIGKEVRMQVGTWVVGYNNFFHSITVTNVVESAIAA